MPPAGRRHPAAAHRSPPDLPLQSVSPGTLAASIEGTEPWVDITDLLGG